MSEAELIPVSDYNQLAVLDLHRITPIKTEYHQRRYWAYFRRTDAERTLREYECGDLTGSLRDYVASVNRVKTRIFEAERSLRANDGEQYARYPIRRRSHP